MQHANARKNTNDHHTFIHQITRLRRQSNFKPCHCIQDFRLFYQKYLYVIAQRTHYLDRSQDKENLASMEELHFKCRNGLYPRSDKQRTHVPDDKVDWKIPFNDYKPVYYTSASVLKKPEWADDEAIKESSPKWNALDGNIDRRSHQGHYELEEGLPRNPIGRTGVSGRGCLGRWGPNHAADPIVTRWKMEGKSHMQKGKKNILQFIAIQRKDNKEWAVPGGMVDPGEAVSETLIREFGEEALNLLDVSAQEKKKFEADLKEFFMRKGELIYKGYVDDPRNTDNAWMETVAMNFHDEEGTGVAKFALHAGSDAEGVKWMDVDSSLQLYASHRDFIKKTAELRKAYWS
ncbi:unnamed protein product [Lymnaea stagnalis]|uniref:Nudix hydrolase domain-containing protein n=1 Tax=Lymnaea stagnalis TaxID=6523 RepID=A0AAV2HMY3_LYMST